MGSPLPSRAGGRTDYVGDRGGRRIRRPSRGPGPRRGLLRLPGLPFAGHRQAAGPEPGLLGRVPGGDGRRTGDGSLGPGGSESDPRLPVHLLRQGFVEAPPEDQVRPNLPIGEIFLDVRLVLLVTIFFFTLAALYSSRSQRSLNRMPSARPASLATLRSRKRRRSS